MAKATHICASRYVRRGARQEADRRMSLGAANIDDLGAYVSALSSTIGHYRGEGECVVSVKK